MNKNFRGNWQNSIITGAKVQVRNDDVNGALRRLKKILDNSNRQKELSKKEFHEKDSIKRKRAKDQAKKRTAKAQASDILANAVAPTGTKWQKSKRKRRRVLDKQNALTNFSRKNGRK